MSLHAADWNFVGKPKWKTVDGSSAAKIPRWVRYFNEEMKPGDHVTLYDAKAAKHVLGWAKANNVPHEVRRFKGGGWRIEKV